MENEDIQIRKCKVCGIAMLRQPSAMMFEDGRPVYFCHEHVPIIENKQP